MPEVKWVLPNELSKQCYRGLTMTPVIPLDDIEAWLKQCIEDGYVNIAQCIDAVRAMRVRP